MKNHALLYVLLLSILGNLLMPQMGQAQALPTSRWTVGAETGLSAIRSCSNCEPSSIFDSFTDINAFSYQLTTGWASYRGARWIGLTGHLKRGNLRVQSTASIGDNDGYKGYPIQRNVGVHGWFLLVGPQFFLRLGQGEFSLEILTGLGMRTGRVRLTSIDVQDLDLRYKPRLARSSSWRLGYTYWPRERFGITTAFEIFTTNASYNSSNTFFSSRSTSGDDYPDISSDMLERIAPMVSATDMFNFMLGVTYRL